MKILRKSNPVTCLLLFIATVGFSQTGSTYVPSINNIAIDLNNHDYASSMGKLYGGSNAPIPYGQFLSFGMGGYSTQFNSEHYADGKTYIRVNGDNGFGSWNYLYHSGALGLLKTDLGLPSSGAIDLHGITTKGNSTTNSLEVGPVFSMKGNNPYVRWLNASGNRLGYIQHNATNLVISADSGNIVLNNNVGIGTETPQEKLSVNGKIRAREIKVETANWPDYVFSKEYKLPDLKETETFIKNNGHLPGVPSATVAEKEGIELGEMNKVLLKKIEELTLHLIELKKEVSELKKIK